MKDFTHIILEPDQIPDPNSKGDVIFTTHLIVNEEEFPGEVLIKSTPKKEGCSILYTWKEIRQLHAALGVLLEDHNK